MFTKVIQMNKLAFDERRGRSTPTVWKAVRPVIAIKAVKHSMIGSRLV